LITSPRGVLYSSSRFSKLPILPEKYASRAESYSRSNLLANSAMPAKGSFHPLYSPFKNTPLLSPPGCSRLTAPKEKLGRANKTIKPFKVRGVVPFRPCTELNTSRNLISACRTASKAGESSVRGLLFNSNLCTERKLSSVCLPGYTA